MSYETWTAFNNASIAGILVIPVALAVVVFLRQRQRHSPDGTRTGRPMAWSLLTFVGSFIALIVVWGFALVEGFPEYTARRDAEYAASGSSDGAGASSIEAIDGVVGSWRPNNANRTDYFTFTTQTYSSVTPNLDTTITWTYRVLRRDGPCMRVETTGSQVVQGGAITETSSRNGRPFIVCVDPETDQMLMRFDSDRGDVFLSRMD